MSTITINRRTYKVTRSVQLDDGRIEYGLRGPRGGIADLWVHADGNALLMTMSGYRANETLLSADDYSIAS